ncbi:MAG TPA: FAD-dependent oxidoreductase, partial [Allocoleopsis sp.]
ILIIGAGISGIAAANQLKSNGFQVTVLEGRNRLGGRIFTDKSLGFPVDLGASWIHGVNGNPITKLAQQFNINTKLTNYDNNAIYNSQGKIISRQQLNPSYTLYKQVIKQLESLGEKLDYDISVAEGIKRILKNKNLNPEQKRLLFWYVEQELTLDLATDLENISLWELNQDQGFDGDDYLFPNGYEQIINKLAEGIDIKLGHKVTEIKYNERKVEVKTTQGDFTGDAAIITLPLGVLKSNSIIFSPGLPKNKLSAINNLNMGVLNKIVLQFPQNFWDKDKDILSYVSENPPEISFFVNLNKYTSNPVIMAFAAGKFGKSLENNSDADLSQRVMKILQTMYGNNIPNPSGLIRTKWHNDPFA